MKKLSVFILVLVMVLAMVPNIALAADATLKVGSGEAYATIQDAVNAAGGGTTTIIIKAGIYSETVQILQQEGKNIILQGEAGTIFKGNLIIDGNARFDGLESVTVKNIAFDKSGTTLTAANYIIDLKTIGTTNSYTHNVTIEDCTFLGDDFGAYTVAIQAGSAGGNTAYDTVVRNCTFKHLHSAIQARCHGLTVENITATDLSEGGINIQNITNVTLTNVYIEGPKYALRAGESSGGPPVNMNIIINNCVLKCGTGAGSQGAIYLRATCQGDITISSSDIFGPVVNLSSNTATLAANDVYWRLGVSGITGFAPTSMNIQNNAPTQHKVATEVTAGVDPSYIVVIPASVDFGILQKDTGMKEKPFPVEARNLIVEENSNIDVKVTSINSMDDGYGNLLAYTLKNSVPNVVTTGTFTTFSVPRTETGSVSVDTGAIAKAGSYKGTMTFNISYGIAP